MPEMLLAAIGNGELRGATEADDRAWKRVKGWLKSLGAGELVRVAYKRPRDGIYHRKYMAMVRHAFEHWEPEHGGKPLTYRGHVIAKDFERFRKDVLILSGFYHAIYDIHGGVQLEPLSISFDAMDQDEFERVYEATLSTLLAHVLTNYKREDLERVVAGLQEFGE